jgi:TRAP-type C4-dicarboxylate transport system permease small subunit
MKEQLMEKFFNTLRNAILGVCNIFMITQVIVINITVFGRYIFNKTPGWGEPVALLCMVWFCLLSAALVVKDDRHLSVTVIDYILPAGAIKYFNVINDIIISLFALFMIVEGAKLTQLSTLNIIPGLNIKSSWLSASVPVSGAAFLAVLIEKELVSWKKKRLQ